MSQPGMLYEVFQTVIVGAVVLSCAVYCLLHLTPMAWREVTRRAMLCLPLPAFMLKRLQPSARTGTCATGCSGCDAAVRRRAPP